MVKKTVGSIEQKSLAQNQKQYEIVGRAAPTQKIPVPKIYKMKIFAKNLVLARSKFWYFMKRINKAKRTGGEVLRVTELFDTAPTKVSNLVFDISLLPTISHCPCNYKGFGTVYCLHTVKFSKFITVGTSIAT